MHSCRGCACNSAHNRFQWQRYGQQRDLMLATAATEHRFDEKKVLRETLLWHGTSDTDPMVVCTSRDGVDARRVRKAGWRGCILVTVSNGRHLCGGAACSPSLSMKCAHGHVASICTVARIRCSMVMAHIFRILQRTVTRATRLRRQGSLFPRRIVS